MVMINTHHAEWAIVDRMRQMLSEPPHRKFNVTQSYGLCTGILAWVMQRIRTPVNQANTLEARVAVSLGDSLKEQKIEKLPWALKTCQGNGAADFSDYSAFDFLAWLRNAICHGDARQIFPINHKNTLIGFEIRATARNDRERKILLHEDDLRRIGETLANVYCNTLKSVHDDDYFDRDAGTLREKGGVT